MKKLWNILLIEVSFAVVVSFYPGFEFADFRALLITSSLFVIYQVFVRPALKIFSLPLNLLTLGFFNLVLTIAFFYVLASLVPGFEIVGFETAGFEFFGWEVGTFIVGPLLGTMIGSFLLSVVFSVVALFAA